MLYISGTHPEAWIISVMWLQGWWLLSEKNYGGRGISDNWTKAEKEGWGVCKEVPQEVKNHLLLESVSKQVGYMRWVSQKASLDLAESEHAWSAWLLSWWNDSSCMRNVAPVSSVRLSAWSPAVFLPESWGSTGLDKIVGWIKNWLGHCSVSNQRLSVQLLTGIKDTDTVWSLEQWPAWWDRAQL